MTCMYLCFNPFQKKAGLSWEYMSTHALSRELNYHPYPSPVVFLVKEIEKSWGRSKTIHLSDAQQKHNHVV